MSGGAFNDTWEHERVREVNEKLEESHRQGQHLTVEIPHGTKMLSSFSVDFWTTCFVNLFCRGDCRERYSQHKQQTQGRT